MNERIKLLIEQATTRIDPIAHDGACWDFDKEKFAELIVKECMDIARTVGNISEPDDWALDRCYEIEQRIQDRFGVEL
jgi:hypothetical protein